MLYWEKLERFLAIKVGGKSFNSFFAKSQKKNSKIFGNWEFFKINKETFQPNGKKFG